MLQSFKHELYRATILSLLCLACLASCDVDDERDLCCNRVVMEYHYMRDGQDKFKENIFSLRHFLFDNRERFIQELSAANNLQFQVLDSLLVGNYTMVTVGNAAEGTELTTPTESTSLHDFMLHIAGTDGRNADPLYYGICRFTLPVEDVKRELRFQTQMSNVHCRLKVTVKWQHRPPVLTEAPIYRMKLEGCGEDYELDAVRGYAMGEKQYPNSPAWQQEHRINCSLNSRELKETFISLRYTNENLPTLHILYREEGEYVAVTPPLDLKKAFLSWGYRPSTVERQDYKIVVTIYMDGHVGVKVEIETGIADWADGGSFG